MTSKTTNRFARLWVSDFTYIATWAGFVYVAFVIDTYARRIAGWRASGTAHASFVLDVLEWVDWFNHRRLRQSPKRPSRSKAISGTHGSRARPRPSPRRAATIEASHSTAGSV